MSKRTKLYLALGALVAVAVLLAVLFMAVIMRGGGPDDEEIVQAPPPEAWTAAEVPTAPPDPWADKADRAVSRVQNRTVQALPVTPEHTRWTARQVVETEFLQTTFPNLRWRRIERVGWQAFQLEGSVYEVQFVLRDGAVDFGPAWVVQLDPDGMQPPNTGGIVAANVFAEAIERGVSEELDRYLNREDEVLEALTNHQFAGGVRLGSALLVYFKSRRVTARNQQELHLEGWTVVPERIEPGQITFYRASFQWRDGDTASFAQWEVNLDTREFRGLNLLASDIMAAGDEIQAAELQSIRPVSLDATEVPPRQRRIFAALRAIADNQRLMEAVVSLLWHRDQRGAEIDYRIGRDPQGNPALKWRAEPVEDVDGLYDVSYSYLDNGTEESIVWRVNVAGEAPVIEPRNELARLGLIALSYVEVPELEQPPSETSEGTGDGTGEGTGVEPVSDGTGDGTGLGTGAEP